MHIVSLLPSLTELVCALGHEHELVGVTHECDFPPTVQSLPSLTRNRISLDATSREIDELGSSQHESLYDLEEDVLTEWRPT